ncbi:MAG: CFI-box-CTERM domain-containing protein [Nitrospirota bacterium]
MLPDSSAWSVCRAWCLTAVTVLLVGAATAQAETATVSSGESIADAIQAATAGDTLIITTGEYTEHLVIDKNLTIQAEDGAKVVIIGVGSEPVVTIRPNVSAKLTRLILRRSATGVQITQATATLENVVIAADTSTGTAIRCEQTAGNTITITRATIHRGEHGIVCAAQSVSVTNTIFSTLTQGVDLGTLVLTGEQLFYQTPPPGTYTRVDTGLEFVDETENDFHLTAASTNAFGQVTDSDTFGAYGGASAHTKPFPPRGVSVVCAPPAAACTVSWTKNADHLVTGYQVSFAAPLVPADATYAGTADGPITSPHIIDTSASTQTTCTGTTCALSLSGLNTSVTAPDPPTGLAATFGDTRIYLAWNASAAATSYQVLSGTTSGVLTVVPGKDRVAETSTTLEDLVNGTIYYAAVAAATEPTLTAVVASLYGTPTASPTIGNRSDPEHAEYGTAVTGAQSAEVSEIPEPVVGFPPLAEGRGCFIATAAYGSLMAPQVDLLRAWRDRYLLTNPPGRVFVRTYEAVSPPIADVLRRSELLRTTVRWALAPVIGVAWLSMEWPWLSLACGIVGMVALAAVVRSRRGRARA